MDEKPTEKSWLEDAIDTVEKLEPSTVSTVKEVAGGAAGAGLLGMVGTHVGIAALGTAISGVLPFAIVGGYLGWLGMRKLNHFTAPKTEDNSDKKTPND